MKYSNELKVGAALVAATVMFIFGLRFFQDIPLFAGSYELRTELADSKGLIAGNPVRVKGVKVGAVTRVNYDQMDGLVHVRFRIDNGIVVPQGTMCSISGIDALTGIRLELKLGNMSNSPLKAGDMVPTVTEAGDFLADLTGRAPRMLSSVDSVLAGLDLTITDVRAVIGRSDSDLRQTLAAMRGGAETLNEMLAAERERISSLLSNVDRMTSNLSALTETQQDSIALMIQRLNTSATSMESAMGSLESTMGQLDAILGRIDRGEGTLGRLVNDESLYVSLDSAAASLSALLADLQQNPRRYLREMKLIDVF